MQERQRWLAISDSEVTSAALEAELERRVAKRRLELGEDHLVAPSFATLSTFPEPPLKASYSPALYYHLRRANQLEPQELEPLLADNRGSSIPILGHLSLSIRRQFHQLVLFYLNRALQDEHALDNHMVSTLNEMTRVIQQQQQEIEELKTRIHLLEKGQQ